MECMGAKALKSSFTTEIGMKSDNQHGNLDDMLCVNGDEFSIEEFFNLPNEEIINNNLVLEEEDEEKESNSSSFDPLLVVDSSLFPSHLVFPDDDMQELELWSHFMDDSVPDSVITCPKPSMDAQNKKAGFTSSVNPVEPYVKQSPVRASLFPMAVPAKPRSKRSRSIGNGSWFTGSPPKTESSSSSPSSPVSTLLFAPPVHDMGMLFTYGKPPLKKPKKKPAPSVNNNIGLSNTVQRRCTHCQVSKTPLWREGPNGPKTLCNACGVRFKSGRLFPEYRPACSPTFSREVHSNSHRKVLEMRRKKETPEPFTGSAQQVPTT